MRVAIIQQKCFPSRQESVHHTMTKIEEAVANGAQLVCLQELHTGYYFCQREDVCEHDRAETIPGQSTQEFGALSEKLGIVIVTSLYERRAAGIYHNTSVVLEDGKIAGIYRKMHIPDDPSYYEKFYFTPGDLGFMPIQTRLGKLGVLVCWDQWYPEAARIMALNGADILIYPTAIGWTPSDSNEEKKRQMEAWVTIQRSHAVANGLPVVSINRVGYEPDPSSVGEGLEFWGRSFIAGPQGEFLCFCDHNHECVEVVDIDMKKTEIVRRWWPFFRDRRIDAYGDLLTRWGS